MPFHPRHCNSRDMGRVSTQPKSFSPVILAQSSPGTRRVICKGVAARTFFSRLSRLPRLPDSRLPWPYPLFPEP